MILLVFLDRLWRVDLLDPTIGRIDQKVDVIDRWLQTVEGMQTLFRLNVPSSLDPELRFSWQDAAIELIEDDVDLGWLCSMMKLSFPDKGGRR